MTERMTKSELTDIADYISYRKQAGSAPHNERDNIGTMAQMLEEIRALRAELKEIRVGELTVTCSAAEGYNIKGLTHAQARGLDLLISSRHAVYLPEEMDTELGKLLGVMLPVLGGMADINTISGEG